MESKTKKYRNTRNFQINEQDVALVKAVFHLNEKHFNEFQQTFENKYATVILKGKKYKLKVYYDGDKTDEVKLKKLILTYLDMNFKIEKVQSDKAAKMNGYNKENIYFNNLETNEVEIIGLADDVESLINDKDKKFNLAEFRILVLKNFKNEIEKKSNIKLKFDKGENDCYKLSFESGGQEMIEKAKEEANRILTSLKKIKFGYDKSIILNLKDKDIDATLFRRVQEENLVCSFEYDDASSEVIAYVESIAVADQVRKLLDDFINTKLLQKHGENEASGSKCHFNLNQFEHRLIIMNSFDKTVKQKWPNLIYNFNKKAKKCELTGDENAIGDSEKMIKTFVSKIKTERVPCDKEKIEKIKLNECKFIESLMRKKIYCVVEFDLKESALIFHSTNSDIINTCKEFILVEFLNKL